jgi:hypothetical protein
MKEKITTKVEGVELTLLNDLSHGETGDLWIPPFDWDGPNTPASISEWKKRITAWRIAKQVKAGFEIWNLENDQPKYWRKRPAVFREGKEERNSWSNPPKVLTRNSAHDPDRLYGIARGFCAMDTPEVAEAIAAALALYEEAVAAHRRFRDAERAIPRMTTDEWRTLPAKPGSDQ